jgi:DNA (cytosine-5)-methyltransferase 1
MLIACFLRAIGQHRGAPRLYLDGAPLKKTSFQPGTAYAIGILPGKLILEPLDIAPEDGRARVVSVKIRGHEGKTQPVIDINSHALLSTYARVGTVRIMVYATRIEITVPASELARHERLTRLLRVASDGQPLRVGSTAHGVGVLSHALHTGLADAGWQSQTAFANEIDEALLMTARQNNDRWQHRTMAMAVPVQELVQDQACLDQIGTVDILEAGIPCSAASKAGKAKRGLSMMEAHPIIGHLAVPVLMLVQRVQPIALLIENVPEYASSASAELLRKVLTDMGYTVKETRLQAREFETMEARDRWFLLAVTRGIELEFEDHSPRPCNTPLHDLLEKVDDGDPRWSDFGHLKLKQERDTAQGKCFAMQVLTPQATQVPTLRKGYAKCGSTDPLLQNPATGKLRCFTVTEHARIKGVPPHLVDQLGHTRGHQALGQSVAYRPVRWLGQQLGQALNRFASCSTGSRQDLEVRPRTTVTG